MTNIMNKSGIYQIRNLINNKIYIGSAIVLRVRKNSHFGKLYRNKHENFYLQNSYNKYGKDNFIFEVLEYVECKDELLEREQYYFDNLKPEYNISLIAGNCLGVKHTEEFKRKLSKIHKGTKLSEETKQRMSESQKGRICTDRQKQRASEIHKLKKMSEETKNKISKSKLNHSRLTSRQVFEIKIMLNQGLNQRIIAQKFNVSSENISSIKRGVTWKNINILEGSEI